MVSKVIIFGGSFNPITVAHTGMAIEAYNFLEGEAQLWFVPTTEHAFHKQLAFFPNRLKWIEDSIEMLEITKIKYDPKGMGKYMIDYLHNIEQSFPFDNFEFHILIGSDILPSLHKWKDWEKLWEYNFIIMQRASEDIDEEAIIIPKYAILKSFSSSISSTEVRQRCFAGKDITGLVPSVIEKNVQEVYSRDNKFYT